MRLDKIIRSVYFCRRIDKDVVPYTVDVRIFMDESSNPLQAEILSRLNSLEDRIIEISKQINVIEGMGAIEKSREKIERTKQEILEQLMERQNARYRDAS